MAKVGKWGKEIKFSVNTKKQLSFANMKRSSSGRWVEHNIIGKRPKSEYLGPSMDNVTMDVILDADMGVNPRETMKNFRFACKKGDVNYLYIGGRKVCKNKMKIIDVSEAWERIWSKGELVRAVVSVTFSEYR